MWQNWAWKHFQHLVFDEAARAKHESAYKYNAWRELRATQKYIAVLLAANWNSVSTRSRWCIKGCCSYRRTISWLTTVLDFTCAHFLDHTRNDTNYFIKFRINIPDFSNSLEILYLQINSIVFSFFVKFLAIFESFRLMLWENVDKLFQLNSSF